MPSWTRRFLAGRASGVTLTAAGGGWAGGGAVGCGAWLSGVGVKIGIFGLAFDGGLLLGGLLLGGGFLGFGGGDGARGFVVGSTRALRVNCGVGRC